MRRPGLLRRADQGVGIIGRLRLAPEEPLESLENVTNGPVWETLFHAAALCRWLVPKTRPCSAL